ncbi:uncharacterized protein L201_004582 [Kwoniella dendrophila CBS 6074]|uniref:Short-chain dehydrogenase n=1 Tax=Kwoniella dendrophila CBS 6074 TaxID=1295534 RepID=A0AAX4JWB2_9TREE
MSKIALILGTGANIGKATAVKFRNAGYKVATVSRTPDNTKSDNALHLTADFADPTSIEPIFDQVQAYWGNAPNVVIYNAAATVKTADRAIEASITDFTRSLNVNTVSPYTAAGIAQSRDNTVTFIYTGNALNTILAPSLTLLGVGKTASAKWITEAAKDEKLRPSKFYYADQRRLDGSPCYTGLNGEAHADLFLKLAEQKEQGEPIIIFRA